MKTTRKVLLLLAVILFISSNAYAQLPLSLGVKAGANLSNIDFDYDDDEGLDNKAKMGFQVGVDAKLNIPMTGFFLQSGLALTTKGVKIEGSYEDQYEKYDVEQKVNAMFLQLPIMAGYSVDAAGLGVNFMVGPYFAYGIGGKTKSSYTYIDKYEPEYNESDSNKEDTFDEDKGGIKKFDMGLTGAVGIEVSKFYVNLGYEFGLTDLAGKHMEDVKVKNRTAFLTVGYKIF